MPKVPVPPEITVAELLERQPESLSMRLLAGSRGLANKITTPRIQKPGLAMTGFVRYLRPGRVQVIGKSEMAYLGELPTARRREVIEDLCRAPMTCMVLTTGLHPPEELIEQAD